MKLHLAIDSTGRTQGSKKRDYTKNIVSDLAADNGIALEVTCIPGADLPELTRAIEMKDPHSDAHFLLSMCNVGVSTIDHEDMMPQDIFAACDDLSKVRAPVTILYGGPGELWQRVSGNSPAWPFYHTASSA